MGDSRRSRSMRPRPGRTQGESDQDVERIIVRFKDDVEPPAADVTLGTFGLRFTRLFSAVEPNELAKLVTRARARDHQVPNLLRYFIADVPHELSPDVAIAQLLEEPAVDIAYLDVRSEDAIVNPNDDDPAAGWVQNQGYLDPAPEGIDAEFAWPRADGTGFPGGDGAGVCLIVLEKGWNVAHPDLVDHNIQLLHGAIDPGSAGHGNASLGVLCARDNLIGCVGIAPWVDEIGVVSSHGSTKADALLAAIVNLSAGDVLVIESQLTSLRIGGVDWGAMPLEVLDAEFWLIRLATALDITVVEAAGNSFEKLDDFVDAAGNRILNRSDPGFRDSGAIMVSAASSTVPHEPLIDPGFGTRFHHYGSRVDCYAWGNNVTSLTGVGYVLGGFANTSAATAIVGGAALVVQGVARANGMLLNPGQLRSILSDEANGTESRNGAAVDGLGVMPDLRKILLTNDVLGVLPDVYLRDFIGDTGDPHLGAISASPDIFVVPQQSMNPQVEFGDPNLLLGSEAEAGQNNYVYVRALNRGTVDAANVKATVYWADVSTLVTPEQWHLIGSVDIPLVQTGNSLTVSPAIVWPAAEIPNTGHYCFVGTLDHPKDPVMDPIGLASLVTDWALDWTLFERLIRDNNNITWRNFNVVDNVPDAVARAEWLDFVPLPFIAAGAPDRARPMRLRFVGRLPEGARMFLDVPISMYEWARAGSNGEEWHGIGDNRVRVLLKPGGSLFDEFMFPARARLSMNLLVQIPPDYRQNAYDVYVSQSTAGTEVGRITWRLTPRAERNHSVRQAQRS